MASRPESPSANEYRLEDLFNAAHKDPDLKQQLLANPAQVAKQWDVTLHQRDVERLTKLGAFAELAREARLGSLFRTGDPQVWYASQFWLQQEVINMLREFISPADLPLPAIQSKLDRTLYLGNNPGNQGRNTGDVLRGGAVRSPATETGGTRAAAGHHSPGASGLQG